jgi:predicted nucleic acid-binding protein
MSGLKKLPQSKHGTLAMPKVISNTGPLIALASIDQLELLHQLFEIVYIPPAVRAEILDQHTLLKYSKALVRKNKCSTG